MCPDSRNTERRRPLFLFHSFRTRWETWYPRPDSLYFSQLVFVLLWTMEGARSFRIEMLAICSFSTEKVALTFLKYASTFVFKMARRDFSLQDHLLENGLEKPDVFIFLPLLIFRLSYTELEKYFSQLLIIWEIA